MKTLIAGYGVQGKKRRKVAGGDVVAIADPVHPDADFKSLKDVPPESYDAACLCIPDAPKFDLIEYLLSHQKHVLVEKPLVTENLQQLEALIGLSEATKTTCYTAYNHRFEPHFQSMEKAIKEGVIGDIYSMRLFYGNGTARLVRDSVWRDTGTGVLHDLGSHLLDSIDYWIGRKDTRFLLTAAHCFENRSFDHAILTSRGEIHIQLEMSLLSWKNEFFADVYGAEGSAHIKSLCKWGPSEFTIRKRKLPSGRPEETTTTLAQEDPTWQKEYSYFKSLCESGGHNLHNDLWIKKVFDSMESGSDD